MSRFSQSFAVLLLVRFMSTEGAVKMDKNLQQFVANPPAEPQPGLAKLDGLYRLRNCESIKYIMDVRGDIRDRKQFTSIMSRPWTA